MHLLVIGGSDAGISAALRAHELNSSVEITLLLADDFPNFSICGLPYYLRGETPDWRDLAHRKEFPGIKVLRRHEARAIDAGQRAVSVAHEGAEATMRYNKLIVATGATPVRPELPGYDLPNVFPLHTMEDSFAVHRRLEESPCESAVLIGGGYIGLEMADALTKRGLAVTLLSRPETVMPTVDAEIGLLVEEELRRHGVRVITNVAAARIEWQAGSPSRLTVSNTANKTYSADLVIVAAGARPESSLAQRAGAQLGVRDAIVVTRQMRANLTDVFAAGDCVETYHRLVRHPTYISLGTIAHKQGRVAGENAVGGDRAYAGALGTQSLKVFDLAVVCAGLRDRQARAEGFDSLTVASRANDHKAYYPGATSLDMRMTGDLSSGRLLGAQIAGNRKAEVSKRIDIVAAALFQEARVEDLNDLDLSYTPPFSSPWDSVQMAAQSWAAAVRERLGTEGHQRHFEHASLVGRQAE
jgi:NADPH-dependent 2,4-dienoyl-CoA reductase/sulfur reductase-like enzyme